MAEAALRFGLRATAALIALGWNGIARADMPRLSGIVIAGAERVAIFAGTSGEATRVVREGDLLGDENVVGIDARGVWFDGPAGKRLVTFGQDTSTRAALAAAVPPAPLIDPYRRERETENDQ